MDNKLSEFVNEQMKSGVKSAELKDHLVKNGWNEEDVNSAINYANGKKVRSRILIGVLGIILVGILALILISFAKNSSPNTNINNGGAVTNNAGGELKTNNPVNDCAAKEDSTEKDACYKTLLKSGFDCSILTDNVESTYCTRAYEDLNLKGVERIVEG